MNRITLSERLSHLKDGRPSDPSLYNELLQSIANMTLAEYIGDEKLLKNTAESFDLCDDMDKVRNMTYIEAALRVEEMWHTEKHDSAVNVLINLMRPYYVEYKRRKTK